MRGLKRVFALAVVFAMILSCVPAMAATTFVDVNEDDAVVVDVLTSLGIIQGYDEGGSMYFKGENTITRAEFAAVVTRLLGMEDSAKTQRDTIFTDVPASHWASGYITTAVDTNGIIVGMGDNTFAPESPVTYEQAVKMLVCALGYETKALEEGTYPTGYIFVAKTIGLIDDVNGSVGEEAKRSTVAKLLYNSLDVPLMQKILSGTSKSYYGIYDGQEYSPRKTVMSEYLNIVKLVGSVTKNEVSTGGREGIVTISITDNFNTRFAANNDIYKVGKATDFEVGETNAKDLIGYEVLAFVTYTSSRTVDPTILAIQDNSKNGTKFTLDLDMIKAVQSDGTVTTITYYTDEAQSKTSKLYVAADADELSVYFNGIYDASYTGNNFAADFANPSIGMSDLNGTLELRSTKTTGAYDYDVMSFTIYKTFVVGEVNGSPTYKVYPNDDFGYDGISYIPFDPEDKDITTSFVDVDGNEVNPEDLEAWDVLSVKVDDPLNKVASLTKDKTVFDCILVQDSINGTVTEIDSSSETPRIVIDGTAYELASEEILDDINLGDGGAFYLDANNKIAAFDKNLQKTGNFGVILTTGRSASTSVNDFYQVKMYTAEGALSVFDLADKVKIMSKTADDKYSYGSVNDDVAYASISALATPAVVTYGTNANGEINKICYQLNMTAGSNPISYNQIHNKADIYANALAEPASIVGENRDYPTLKVDSSKSYYMNEDTKVVVLDTTATDYKNVKLDEFDSYAGTDFTADIDDITNVSVYNVNSNNYAGFVFIQGSVDSTFDTTGVALVKSISEATNSEGTEVNKYAAVTTAAEGVETFVEAENFKVKNGKTIANGTVIVPGNVDANGEIKEATTLTYVAGTYGTDNKPFFSFDPNYMAKNWKQSGDVEYYFGKVTNKSANTVYFDNELAVDNVSGGVTTFKTTDEALRLPSSKVALVYDARKNASNRVFASTCSEIPSFVKAKDANDKVIDGVYVPSDYSDSSPVTYYIFVREYNGTVEDVVIYIYDNANPAATVSAPPAAEPAAQLDAIISEEEDVIIED